MQRRELYRISQRLGLLVVACLLFFAVDAQPATPPPQGGNTITIDKTDVFHFATFGKDSLRIRKLLGNVVLSQDTTKLYCDSAYQFIDSNFVEAYSNVRIVMSAHLPDSMQRTITSDRLTFDGDTKIIDFWNNVVLTDKDVTLRTPRLTYYRIQDYAEYLKGGVIVNDSNTLTSRRGYYYPQSEMAYFRDSVVLVNPDFVLTTDTLGYNTKQKVAFFMAPTYVHDSVNNMYTEDGYYDTERDFVLLSRNASIGDTSYTVFADTIEYDQERDLGVAKKHLKIVQKDSSLTIYGKYGEFQSKTETSFVTDSAFAIQKFDDDTLFLFADTLSSYKDTVTDKRYFEAYNKTNFYMNEMQGVCDSMVYWYDDSLMFFYVKPAIWSDNSQITGDTIIMQLKKGGIDSMSIPSGPFIITQEDTVGYDQVKGKELHAKFLEKQLHRMWIFGNSESIYFTKDEKDGYLGMNKARCSDMYIEFKDNKPTRILFKDKPEGEFFPIHMVLYKENKLEGFEWRIQERPVYPEWVFEHIYYLEGRRDTIEMRLDSVLLTLEEVEFEINNLFEDSILGKFLEGRPPKDTVGVTSIGRDSLGPDSLIVEGPDSLGTDSLIVEGLDSLGQDSLVEAPRDTLLPGMYQPWEMKGDEPASNVADSGQVDKEPKPGKEKQPKAEREKRSFKDRIRAVALGIKAFKQRLKNGPSKEEIAAKQKRKLERMKKRVQKKAERDKRRADRKLQRRLARSAQH